MAAIIQFFMKMFKKNTLAIPWDHACDAGFLWSENTLYNNRECEKEMEKDIGP